MRTPYRFVVASLLCGAGAACARGVSTAASTLIPGDRMRVLTACPRPRTYEICDTHVAAFQALTPDTLQLQTSTSDDPLVFPLKTVARLEVSRGRTNALAIGVGVGAVAGMVVAVAASGSQCSDYTGSWPCIPPALAYGPLIGGAVGGLVGSAIHRERWVRVSLPPPGQAAPESPQVSNKTTSE